MYLCDSFFTSENATKSKYNRSEKMFLHLLLLSAFAAIDAGVKIEVCQVEITNQNHEALKMQYKWRLNFNKFIFIKVHFYLGTRV